MLQFESTVGPYRIREGVRSRPYHRLAAPLFRTFVVGSIDGSLIISRQVHVWRAVGGGWRENVR